MTTTIPTPGDLARRSTPPALTAQPAVDSKTARRLPPRPAVTAEEPFRLRYETALRYSGLRHTARYVALALATFADWDSGSIAPQDQPGIPRIQAATGLGESPVRNSLKHLAAHGWLRRTTDPWHERAGDIVLTIPPGAQTGP